MEEFKKLLDKVNRAAEELRTAINDVLAKIPGWASWVADKLIEAWNYLCGKLAEFWAKVTELWNLRGDPDALERAANEWTQRVGGPVSQRAGFADSGALRTDDTWDGTAAENYRQTLPAQQGAMSTVKSMTDSIASALMSLRTGILTFWIGAGTAVVALIAGILGAITATGTIIGAPAGVVIGAGAVASAVVAIIGGVVLLNAQASDANSSLVRVLNEGPDYPGGRWPTAAV